MSRTYRKDDPRPYNKEKKEQRKRHYRKARRAAKEALREEEEPGPFAYRTSGWLTH